MDQATSTPEGWEAVDATPQVDQFAAPKDNKEGLYQMHTAEGTAVQVPYSKVMDAYKAGYKISPNDRLRYANDRVAELKGKGNSRIPELNMLDQMGAQQRLNPDTDLPEAYHEVEAQPKAGTADWFKQKYESTKRGALDLLPTAGGIGGGIAGAAAGAPSGPGAVASAVGGAAVGGAVGEAVRQKAEEFAYPYEHRMGGKEKAKKIAVEGALQGANELTGRAAGKILGPAVNYFGKTASESAKAGVKLLPSEAAGKAPSYAEKFLKGSVLTSGKMEKFRAMQNAQTQEAVTKLADKISNFKGTPEQLGKLVQSGIDQHTANFRVIQNQMYDDIGKQVGERTIKVPVQKQVASGVLGPNGQPLMRTITTLEDRIVDNVMPSTVALKKFAAEELKKLDQVEKVLDPNLLGQSRSMLENLLHAPNNMPYSAMRAARSDTLAKVRELDQALAGKQAGLAKKMAGLFDDSIMDAVQKSKIPGLEAQVRAADAFTANEHRMFEQALIKKVVDTKKPEAISTLIRGKSIGNEETRDLFKILPPELHKPVQRQVIIDAMRQATNNTSKAFNERKFAETIGGIGDERGQIIFGSNWKNIKELTGIMERINGPVGMQGGAGAALQNFSILKNLMLAATPFGLAEHGKYGAAVGSLAAEWASLNALAAAMTHPEAAVKMLNVARQFVKNTPYAVTGAIQVASGQKKARGENPKSLLDSAKELQNSFHRGGMAPQPAQAAPPAPAPQPQSYTHVFDPDSGQIVPVQ